MMKAVYEIAATALPKPDAVQQALTAAGISAEITERPDQSFLGFKNYATGLISLWIDNNREMTAKFYTLADQHYTAADIAQAIRQHIEQLQDRSGVDGILSDLLNAAIVDADYHEVAADIIRHVIEDKMTAG
jgi:hypothetical protein